MIKFYKNPSQEDWPSIIERPNLVYSSIRETVMNILNQVKETGDTALVEFTDKFDEVWLNRLRISEKELEERANSVPQKLKDAIDQAYENIYRFHTAQIPYDIEVETMPGVHCKLKYLPLQTVGLYIPGGTAPLFSSVLMLAIPAQIAGCKEICICTPPDKNGEIHPAICYAALRCGVKIVYNVGGAQAIGAMAFGTESIPKADKIFGPGNQFVTMAKQLVNVQGVAIDMPAGPSELAVFADESADPEFVAADLLSQAEHGADSQVLLVTTSDDLKEKVKDQLQKQLQVLPRKSIAEKALEHSRAVLFNDCETAFQFLNTYAPEHLIIASENAIKLSERVQNAGSVFLGNLTPEAAGDYASGTNHTLPTNGTAVAYSGITVSSYMKTITFQELKPEGVRNLSDTVETMAEYEELQAHQNAMKLRREKL